MKKIKDIKSIKKKKGNGGFLNNFFFMLYCVYSTTIFVILFTTSTSCPDFSQMSIKTDIQLTGISITCEVSK